MFTQMTVGVRRLCKGTTSGMRVATSMMVNRYPFLFWVWGRGPTQSLITLKKEDSTGLVCNGAEGSEWPAFPANLGSRSTSCLTVGKKKGFDTHASVFSILRWLEKWISRACFDLGLDPAVAISRAGPGPDGQQAATHIKISSFPNSQTTTSLLSSSVTALFHCRASEGSWRCSWIINSLEKYIASATGAREDQCQVGPEPGRTRAREDQSQVGPEPGKLLFQGSVNQVT